MDSMAKFALVATACLGLSCTGDSERMTGTEEDIVEENVRLMASRLSSDLGRKGPIAWMDYFAEVPGFFMASDGQAVFPDYETASTFVDGLAGRIAAMRLDWSDLRVEPLTKTMAVMGAAYEEGLTDTAGTAIHFGGYFTGLAVETPDGWRFRNLHWSSPRPPE